jgi:hypothetical protein
MAYCRIDEGKSQNHSLFILWAKCTSLPHIIAVEAMKSCYDRVEEDNRSTKRFNGEMEEWSGLKVWLGRQAKFLPNLTLKKFWLAYNYFRSYSFIQKFIAIRRLRVLEHKACGFWCLVLLIHSFQSFPTTCHIKASIAILLTLILVSKVTLKKNLSC